jgi:hypothetical protein
MRFLAAKRNTMLNSIDAVWDGALIRGYSGTRPTNADTALAGNTLLFTMTMAGSGSGMGSASAGVITAGSITSDSSADATGTLSFVRILESDGTTVIGDASVGTSGAEFNFSTLSVVSGVVVSCSSFTVELPVGS